MDKTAVEDRKETDMDLGHHKAVLTRMCRICGTHCNDLKPYSAVHFTSTFAEDTKTLGVDTSDDDPTIHPPAMCKKCIGEVCRRTDKDQPSAPVETFHFEPHKEKDCEICKHPCSACLLIPDSVPAEGSLVQYKISEEQAVKERHRHLMKSIIQLTSKLAPVKCESETLSAYSEEHSTPCKLCASPCPLCGMTLRDASGSYLIRCKAIATSTRVLRTRKRKIPVYDDKEEEEEPVASKKAKKPDKTVPIKDVAILPKIKSIDPCLVHSPNMLTFTGHDGKTYKVPVVSNAKPSAPRNNALSQKIPQASIKQTSNEFVWPVTSLTNSVVALAPAASSVSIASAFSQVKQTKVQVSPIELPSKALIKPNPPDRQIQKATPPYRRISTRVPLDFQNSQNIPKYTTHSVVVQGKSVTKRSVEFGMAPRTVAKTFHDLYKKHCSLTACIRQALAMAPLLKYKYKFINPVLPSEQCILIGVLSDRDTDDEVNVQLQRLDRFVKENHLASRASAVEELLYSPLQNIGQTLQDGLTKSVSHGSPAPTFSSDDERLNDDVGEQISEASQQQSKTYSCDVCNKTFCTLFRYNRHCDTNSHKLAVITVKKTQAVVQKMGDNAKNGRSFFSRSKLTRNYSELLYQSYQSASMSSEMPIETVYKCYICSNQVSGQLRFMRHLWKHKNSLQFPCTWCGRNFNSSAHMRQHIMRKSCAKQGTSSSSSEPTKLHRLTGKYTGIVPHHYKPFTMQKLRGDETVSVAKCKFCSFVSKDVMAIVCHGRKHVGDYPFRCSKCLFCAVSKAKLVAHQKASEHEGFYVIKRSYPLNAVEVEKLNAMVRRKLIVYNEKGCLEPSSSAKGRSNSDDEAVDAEMSKEVSSSPASSSSKGSWNFCKLCNSAFLDKATYTSHMEHCGSNAGAWIKQEQDTVKDKEYSEEDIDSGKTSPVSEDDASFDGEESSQNDKMSTLDRIFRKISSGDADIDIQDASDIDSMAGSSNEKPLIMSSTTTMRPTRKVKPQKRNRLLDVIAGLSAGNPGHKDAGHQDFSFPDILEPGSSKSPSDAGEEDLVANVFPDKDVEMLDSVSEASPAGDADCDAGGVKDFIELPIRSVKEEVNSLDTSVNGLKEDVDNEAMLSVKLEAMEDNNQDLQQCPVGITERITTLKKDNSPTPDKDEPFPQSAVEPIQNGSSTNCDREMVDPLNQKEVDQEEQEEDVVA